MHMEFNEHEPLAFAAPIERVSLDEDVALIEAGGTKGVVPADESPRIGEPVVVFADQVFVPWGIPVQFDRGFCDVDLNTFRVTRPQIVYDMLVPSVMGLPKTALGPLAPGQDLTHSLCLAKLPEGQVRFPDDGPTFWSSSMPVAERTSYSYPRGRGKTQYRYAPTRPVRVAVNLVPGKPVTYNPVWVIPEERLSPEEIEFRGSLPAGIVAEYSVRPSGSLEVWSYFTNVDQALSADAIARLGLPPTVPYLEGTWDDVRPGMEALETYSSGYVDLISIPENDPVLKEFSNGR